MPKWVEWKMKDMWERVWHTGDVTVNRTPGTGSGESPNRDVVEVKRRTVWSTIVGSKNQVKIEADSMLSISCPDGGYGYVYLSWEDLNTFINALTQIRDEKENQQCRS